MYCTQIIEPKAAEQVSSKNVNLASFVAIIGFIQTRQNCELETIFLQSRLL